MSTTPRKRRARRVYMSIAAQPDNLGDIAIRQAAIDMLAGAQDRLVVFVGGMPADYVSAFSFPADSELVRGSGAFMAKYLGDVLRRRAHLIFAPGPLQIRPGIKPAIKASVNLGNVLLARLSGGQVIALGRALRGHGWPTHGIERFAIGAYSLFVARDNVSAKVVGRALDRAPDLAFMREIDSTTGGRSRLAISLRGDREVNAELLQGIVDAARAAGLAPVLVTQVGRDDQKHRELAGDMNVDIVGWDGTGHGAQIDRVEEIYRTSRYVVSDRLHALILGMVKGAQPIALVHPGSDKLISTLDGVVDFTWVGTTATRTPDDLLVAPAEDGLIRSVREARRRLDELAEEVVSLVG
ncbi:polysaccharide pyruvyl transferase family protein [Microbacterium allomyrinae]|uniref:Polysaccharide pyruvyl transferase family protein n=1 Tax=Microbacterium allomyrinae TaxID=2830666 RepID=A0A9X1S5B9_9MICO|nr:polysaccharide pyruvyl transferase family protein [Microbacterium allomyrinae]MCC2034063.1 polysaccharide pyruvyl transferase family protein [Microbacterium allomyrinae]